MEPTEIFICSTYYHVLIAVTTTLLSGKTADIIIMSYIPNYRELTLKLIKSGVFANVILFERNKQNQYYSKSKIKMLFSKGLNAKYIERKLKVDLKRYEKTYIFHDSGELGNYLQAKKCKYTLMEDCLDFFKIIDKTPFYNELPKFKTLKFKIKKLFNIGYICSGQSKWCNEIIVNDDKDLLIPKKKVVVRNKSEQFAKLESKQIKIIQQIFMNTDLIDMNMAEKRVIILTQPLANDKLVKSEEVQVKIYKDIIQEWESKGYIIYIKPHPRDSVLYNNYFMKHSVIDKNAPSEVLGFLGVRFDAAVTINSTAIDSFDLADEKITLGVELLNKY